MNLTEFYDIINIIDGDSMDMKELIKDLDNNLIVKNIYKEDKIIYIECESTKNKSVCPYCGEESSSVHSTYNRKLSDLPIQGNEVKLLLKTKKYFCSNSACDHKTFGERFDFVCIKSVKTNRLVEYINSMALRDNSMDTVRNLKEAGIIVSSNTVLRIVKKNKRNNNI